MTPTAEVSMVLDPATHFVAGGAGSNGVIEVAGPCAGPGLVAGPDYQFELRPLVITSIVQS
jgi:hypothetical protein